MNLINPYFIHSGISYTYKMFKLRNFTVLRGKKYNFMASLHLKKSWSRSMFLTVNALFFSSRAWGDQLYEFLEGMLFRSCLMDICSTVLGLLFWISVSSHVKTFSIGKRSGLQVGHSSTRSFLLHSHAWMQHVVKLCVIWKAFVETDSYLLF